MKKFEPKQELEKMKNNTLSNSTKFKGFFIPMLVLICSVVAIIGTTYSSKNATINDGFTIRVDIINGEEDYYLKTISGGSFMDTIYSDATFASIDCTKGNLEYNPTTHVIYSDNITQDTACILSFMSDGTKNINLASLSPINDNTGTSYYYKNNAENNYIKINDLLFRIIRINGDGTLRLILNNSIGESSFGNSNNYDGSDIERYLNDWFNNNLKNNELIVNNDYDTTIYYDKNFEIDTLISFEGFNISKVGLLSTREYAVINKNKDESFLKDNIALANGYDLYEVWTVENGEFKTVSSQTPLKIYPVINVQAHSLIGQGTKNIPYEIQK